MYVLDFNNPRIGQSVSLAVVFIMVLFILLECWSWSDLRQSADTIEVRLTSISTKLDKIMLQMLWSSK